MDPFDAAKKITDVATAWPHTTGVEMWEKERAAPDIDLSRVNLPFFAPGDGYIGIHVGKSEEENRKRALHQFSMYAELLTSSAPVTLPPLDFGAPPQIQLPDGSKSFGLQIHNRAYFCIIRDTLNLKTDEKLRILDIGAGYGALLEHFYSNDLVRSAAIVDIPYTLHLAHTYLTNKISNNAHIIVDSKTSIEDESIYYCCAGALELLDGEFDLIINTSSFQEMRQEEVGRYIRWCEQHLSDVGRMISLNSTYAYMQKADANVQRMDQFYGESTCIDYIIPNLSVPRSYRSSRHHIAVAAKSLSGESQVEKGDLKLLDSLFYLGVGDSLTTSEWRILCGNQSHLRILKRQVEWLLSNDHSNFDQSNELSGPASIISTNIVQLSHCALPTQMSEEQVIETVSGEDVSDYLKGRLILSLLYRAALAGNPELFNRGREMTRTISNTIQRQFAVEEVERMTSEIVNQKPITYPNSFKTYLSWNL